MGDTITITRRGKPVARRVPIIPDRAAALARPAAQRARVAGPLPAAEIAAARDGRSRRMADLVRNASALAAGLPPPHKTVPDPGPLVRAHDAFSAPWLLRAGIRDIRVVLERRGRLPEGFTDEALAATDALGRAPDTAPVGAELPRLARRHRVTACDPRHHELASWQRAVLAPVTAHLWPRPVQTA